MKAAVLHQLGGLPKYENFPDPVSQHNDHILMHVKAASVKNLDKMRASGAHYASYTRLPAIVGVDGVGTLEDGTRIYATGLAGMIAEKALISKHNYIVLPGHLDDITAAALPNAVIGSAMALDYRAGMKKGDVILVNGATGVTGKIAVQIAKHYGASKIIVTGRNIESLLKLKELGADAFVSLNQADDAVIEQLKDLHNQAPINIVLDYLWGRPAELIIKSLKGTGANKLAQHVKIVTVGEMAGETISLPSGILRSSAIEILGSGIGSIPHEAMQKYAPAIFADMFQLAADGHLKIETETANLKDIEAAWQQETAAGKRLVIKI